MAFTGPKPLSPHTPNWHPMQVYQWPKFKINAWIQEYGQSAPYDGSVWEIKFLPAGFRLWKVWFERIPE